MLLQKPQDKRVDRHIDACRTSVSLAYLIEHSTQHLGEFYPTIAYGRQKSNFNRTKELHLYTNGMITTALYQICRLIVNHYTC